MKNSIHDAFDHIHADESLRDATMRQVQKARRASSSPHRSPMQLRPVLITALCALLILAGIGGYRYTRVPVAYISIDVNPSIELGINRFDKVVSAKAYNADGQLILDDITVSGKYYADAIDAIVAREDEKGYLSTDAALTFTVAAGNSTEESSLQAGIQQTASYTSYKGNCYRSDSSVLEEAHSCGLSFGKYRAYQILSQYDDTITPEDCQDMTMGEIHRQIDNHETGNESDSHNYENGNGNGNGHENENGNGHENENGNGNGNGIGSGNGSENGSGNGSGNGSENGNENGNENGSEHENVSESGNGNGSGNGHGSENGNGSGDQGNGNAHGKRGH